MSVFDLYVGKVAEYVEGLRAKGREVRTFQAPLSFARLGQTLPFRVGPGANPGIILRGDTSVELGNPEAGSSSLFLLTDSPSVLNDGRITLIGPDIPESANASLPFGQVLMLGGAQLADHDAEALQQVQFVGDQIEGYMMRGVSRHIWSRISKEAVAKGMCFNLLGQALMAVCRSASRKLESMEIIFVTSGKADLDPLDGWSVQIQKIAREIIKENWRIKGYDIDCASNCATCKDQVVCDEIKEVLRERQMDEPAMEGVST
jgi:CO dehydrogenase/acetyl-CoA synthase beta subunit